MSTSYSIFKAKFKKTIVDAIYQEVTSKTARYYHWFGKENAWTDFLSPFIGSSASDVPGAPSDNFRYDLHVRRDILTAKLVKPSDVSYVVRRIDWVSGTVYDDYDDAYDTTTGYGYSPAYSGATRLEDANFYVLSTEYNVYKCIWSNNNSPSTTMPTGTSPDVFNTPDGYKWKFMYTIPVSLRNRFLSSEYMPVTNALKDQFYTSGEITSIAIENGGSGYNVATTTAVITGDGYKALNPYAIDRVDISDGGEGYTITPSITISDPFPTAIIWSAEADVNVGSYIKHINPGDLSINFYYIVSGTRLGASGPIHTNGTITNGGTQLQYVGTTATASSSLTGDVITTLTLITAGYGYQTGPTAVAAAPVTKDADWEEATAVTLNDILQYDGRYYEVTLAGTTSTTAPTHTTGTVVDGTAELTFVAKDAVLLPVVEKTEAEINLVISPGIDSVYRVIVSAPSTKYTEVPGVTIAAPISGTTAEATATILNGGVNLINVTAPGDGYVSAPAVTVDLPVKTFDGDTAVDDIEHTITYSGHKLVTGDEIVYTDGGDTTINLLTSTNTYYVIVVDDNTLKLANSLVDAVAGTEIEITSGAGTSHVLTVQTGASAVATLGTGGEIVGYQIVDGGTGYTNTNIEIVDTGVVPGTGAILVADFDVGNIETLQANVELLAVNGAIYTVKMVDGGAGYAAANVEIVGDGTGATATATVTGGKVSHIEMTNPGIGYTWTDLIITGNEGASGAAARAIMTPIGGHGYNAIDELNASNIIFYTSISRDKNQGLEINNDYRKVGLVRNFKKFGSNSKFTEDIGSGCVLITGTFDKTKLQYDMLLTKDGYKKYRIVEFTDTQILLSVFNNFTIDVGDTLITDPTNGGLVSSPTVNSINIVVDAVTERTIDQFSGDFLFFSVRESYSPSADQIITVRTLVEI